MSRLGIGVGVPNAEQYLGELKHVGDDLDAICARVNRVMGVSHLFTGEHRAEPSCVVYHSTTQTISNGAWTPVQFDREVFDSTGDLHNTATDNSIFSIKKAGIYVCLAVVSFAVSAGGSRRLYWTMDDDTALGPIFNSPGNAVIEISAIAFAVPSLAASARIKLQVWQSSGGDLDIGSGTASNSNWAAVFRLPWAT